VTLIILLSFESESVMGKILRRHVAPYTTLTHHEWRHYQGCLQRHLTTLRGQISVDKGLHNFMEMSQPHFEASVRMRFTLPKVGIWSPLGLL